MKGFGLGLNYVQDIVHQMGGNIKVNSERDKGTTFLVTLPFKEAINSVSYTHLMVKSAFLKMPELKNKPSM